MRRNKKCCIDSCVWVKYAGHNRIAVLLKYIQVNSLIVFADRYLLGEVHKTLINDFDFSITEANRVIYLIESFVVIKAPRNIYRFCGDPIDNFLYDLCIQNNCQLLLTVDRTLLLDLFAPFERKTDAWLRKRK
jgi:putative PIN family toxin of toxin-antitoxin system